MVTVSPQQLNGIIYSREKGYCPFSTPSLSAYEAIIGSERMDKLQHIAEQYHIHTSQAQV